MKSPEQKLRDKVGDEFFDRMQSADEEDIARQIVSANKDMFNTKVDKEADEKLKAEKEKFKDMSDVYDEVTRIRKAQVDVCIHVLKDRGQA